MCLRANGTPIYICGTRYIGLLEAGVLTAIVDATVLQGVKFQWVMSKYLIPQGVSTNIDIYRPVDIGRYRSILVYIGRYWSISGRYRSIVVDIWSISVNIGRYTSRCAPNTPVPEMLECPRPQTLTSRIRLSQENLVPKEKRIIPYSPNKYAALVRPLRSVPAGHVATKNSLHLGALQPSPGAGPDACRKEKKYFR